MANPFPKPALPEEHPFHSRDAVKSGLEGVLAGGAVGFFAAAVQNSLAKQNIGSWAVITKHGGTIASFGAFHSLPSKADVQCPNPTGWDGAID